MRQAIEPLLNGDNRRSGTKRDTEYMRDPGLKTRRASPISAEAILRDLRD